MLGKPAVFLSFSPGRVKAGGLPIRRFSRLPSDMVLTRRRAPRSRTFPPTVTKRLPGRAFRVPLRPAAAAAAALTGSQL